MKRLLTTAFILVISANTATAEMSKSGITNEADFRVALSGPGTLSLMQSKIAEDKASNAKVEQFATFEIDEQTAIATVLKELGTPKAVPSPEDEAILEKLKATPAGAEFDSAYIQAQIDGHEDLRSITESYLANNKGASSNIKELHARHLALLARATIKQHLTNAKEIKSSMK